MSELPLLPEPRAPVLSPGRGRALLAGWVAAVIGGGLALYHLEPHHQALAPPPVAQPSRPATVDGTIAALETRTAAAPGDAEAWRTLGWAYFQQQRYDDAVRALRRATRLDRTSPETFAFLGEAVILAANAGGETGQPGTIPPEAARAFNRALRLDPKNTRARYFRAVAADLAGQHRRAIALWLALLRDTPADAPLAEDVREAIRKTGAAHHIPVERRLAEARFAAPLGGSAALRGGGPSAAGIRAASRLPQDAQDRLTRAMAARLATRLAADPHQIDGWVRLMRARMELGESAQAVQAYHDALDAYLHDRAALARLHDAASVLGVPGV